MSDGDRIESPEISRPPPSSHEETEALRQIPLFPMNIGSTSYFRGSKFLIIDFADRSDTSCSTDLPPNITPTVNLDKYAILQIDIDYQVKITNGLPKPRIIVKTGSRELANKKP